MNDDSEWLFYPYPVFSLNAEGKPCLDGRPIRSTAFKLDKDYPNSQPNMGSLELRFFVKLKP